MVPAAMRSMTSLSSSENSARFARKLRVIAFGARAKARLPPGVKPVIAPDAFGLRRDLPHDGLVMARHRLSASHSLRLAQAMRTLPGIAPARRATPSPPRTRRTRIEGLAKFRFVV
ncbi:MAG: hypothetical protein AMXMBFR52_08750 [Burkholderiales bacterium]